MLVGLIGAGRMAQALAKGIIRSGFIAADSIMASAHFQDTQHLDQMSALGCNTSIVNEDVVQRSDVIVVAVKPQYVTQVLKEVSPVILPKHLLVSIALGIPISTIEETLPPKTRVIRVMPNTPSLVMEGASVISSGHWATSDDLSFVKRLFSCVGLCQELPESCMDAVTGLSGSGPAYIYMVIEALADGGVKMGIPRDSAMKLAAQCVKGAAKMVLEEGRHPGALKDDVTSPGGSTIHAYHLLEQAGVRAIFMSAVEEATKTAQKLGAQYK